ncbi:MAG: EAL domain-containing protein [Bilophila wadsworthia]
MLRDRSTCSSWTSPFSATQARPASAPWLSIVQMARALGMSTVAEGVEKQEQEFLRSIGCSAIQGYIFPDPSRSLSLSPSRPVFLYVEG